MRPQHSPTRPLLVGLSLITMTTMLGCDSSQHTITMQDNGVPYHVHGSQDWWHYQFVYHPDAQTYFEPYTQTYFWYEEGAWHAGPESPPQLILDVDRAKVVKLRTDEMPFLQHTTVLASHPPRGEMPAQMDPREDNLLYAWNTIATDSQLAVTPATPYEDDLRFVNDTEGLPDGTERAPRDSYVSAHDWSSDDTDRVDDTEWTEPTWTEETDWTTLVQSFA